MLGEGVDEGLGDRLELEDRDANVTLGAVLAVAHMLAEVLGLEEPLTAPVSEPDGLPECDMEPEALPHAESDTLREAVRERVGLLLGLGDALKVGVVHPETLEESAPEPVALVLPDAVHVPDSVGDVEVLAVILAESEPQAEAELHAEMDTEGVDDGVVVMLRERAGERDCDAVPGRVGVPLAQTVGRSGVALLENVSDGETELEREMLGDAVADMLPLGEGVAEGERVTRKGDPDGVVVPTLRDGDVEGDPEGDD